MFADCAAGSGFRVLAPMLDRPIFIDMRQLPGLLARNLALGHSQRQDRRSSQRGNHVQGCNGERITEPAEMNAERAKRLARLLHMHHAFCEHKARTESGCCPVDDRIPEFGLPIDQPFRRAGAVAQHVG